MDNKFNLKSLMAAFKTEDKVLIIINADPDAIASAVALKRLLWRKAKKIFIVTTNKVYRSDNLRLLKSLKLKLPLLSEIETAEYNKLVLVDSQPEHNPKTSILNFSVIIDHHPYIIKNNKALLYLDIRPEIGSTATMLAQYLKEANIYPSSVLATALFYAIKTDTQNFVRQGQHDDMLAFQWLYPYIDLTLLVDIEKAPLTKKSFNYILKGLNKVIFKGYYGLIFLEEVDHSDSLVILADFLMKIDTVNCAVVASIIDNEKLVIVLRALGLNQNIGKIASDAFGEFGSAGGHKSMARAEIYLNKIEYDKLNIEDSILNFILKALSIN